MRRTVAAFCINSPTPSNRSLRIRIIEVRFELAGSPDPPRHKRFRRFGLYSRRAIVPASSRLQLSLAEASPVGTGHTSRLAMLS